MARSALLNVMVLAASKAGRRLNRDFGEVENLQVSRKGPGDFVSIADTRAEQTIHDELQKARPTYGFLMEESGETKGEDPNCRWIVDPLDGTTNFLHGIPQFAISIALERQNEIVAGVVYNPVTDELFTAEKGVGAFLNDRRLRVAQRVGFHDCVIATGIPHLGRGDHNAYLRELQKVMHEVSGIRRVGAAALDLAWVAAGRFDGYWESGLNAWDIAAGLLIVKEAGGYITEVDGGTDILANGSVCAGNEMVQKNLVRLLQKAKTD